MGMGFPFGSARRASRSTDWYPEPPPARKGTRKARSTSLAPGDPNPARFSIVRTATFGPFTAAEIVWPDAKNYEGRKLAVYRCHPRDLEQASVLDPHFQQQRGPLVPVARFEPTSLGWDLALHCAEMLSKSGG